MADELMNTEVDNTEVDASSEEDVEVATPQDSEDSNVEESTDESADSTQTEEKPIDVNAIAAAARRKAEADAKSIRANIDAEYVRRFGHLTNPKTGAPIRSEADYFAALDAQNEMRTENELKSKGLDPKLIENAVANSPIIRQAQEVIAQNERQATLSKINSDVAELTKLDSSITSLDNVPPDVIQLSLNSNGNIDLVQAYKIINYGKVSNSQQAAITQNAINQAKGKSHLTPISNGSASDDGLRDIPKAELSKWKAFFPDATAKELKEKYNRATKGR